MTFYRFLMAPLAAGTLAVCTAFVASDAQAAGLTIDFQGEFDKKVLDGTTPDANDTIEVYKQDTIRAQVQCLACETDELVGIYTTAASTTLEINGDGEEEYTGTPNPIEFPEVALPGLVPNTYGGLRLADDQSSGDGVSDLFDMQPNNNEETTAGFLNLVAGYDPTDEHAFTAADIRDNRYNLVEGTDNDENFQIVSDAQWLIFKIGVDPNVTVLRNDSGQLRTYTFTTSDREGSGLSSWTGIYDKNVCPPGAPACPETGIDVPEMTATGSIAALGSMFALMAFMFERRGGSRRRRSAA